jgi:hypothetical protein
VTDDKTHYLAIWTIGSGREITPRACVDDTGALLLFATKPVADAFADQLRTYNLDVIVHAASSQDVARLLSFNHDDPEDVAKAAERVAVVEAQATSKKDAEQWAAELADRFMQALVDEFAATTSSASPTR